MKRIVGALTLAVIMMTGSIAADAQYSSKNVTRQVWSQRAKGAAIGAGSGAVIGALVNRNDRAAGAAIGTVVGAGLGYLVGQREDRLNPQPNYVQKRKVYNQYGQVVNKKKTYYYREPNVNYQQRYYYGNRQR